MSNVQKQKFIEVTPLKSMRVQELQNAPFEGVYLGSRQGRHGLNYLFFSEGNYVQIFGTKALHRRMELVDPGYGVKITHLGDVALSDGNTFFNLKVEHTENEVEGFDVAGHLDSMGREQMD